MEIERKFVLPEAPPEIDGITPRALQQGYIAIDGGVEVRIRHDDKKTELTVKTGAGLARGEHNLPLTDEQFEALWPAAGTRTIVKQRYVVALGDDLHAEVDVYGGPLLGLVTAEVEFPSEAASAAFEAPAWLGREVTGDKRYANQALAASGRPVES